MMLSGCQVPTPTGTCQVWLDWRCIWEPAVVVQRLRPPPPAQLVGQPAFRGRVVNWGDRTFVDSRDATVPAWPSPAATPGTTAPSLPLPEPGTGVNAAVPEPIDQAPDVERPPPTNSPSRQPPTREGPVASGNKPRE